MHNPLHRITTDQFRAFYTKTNERTSAPPSGIHLGYWKAAASNQSLSDILVSIINIAITNSYSLKRWTNVTGLLLEKGKGAPPPRSIPNNPHHRIRAELYNALNMGEEPHAVGGTEYGHKHQPGAKLLNEIHHRERQARAWRKISFMTKTFNSHGITRLGIPTGFPPMTLGEYGITSKTHTPAPAGRISPILKLLSIS